MTRTELMKKHKKILKNVSLECNDGWIWLIDELCDALQWDTDKNKHPQVVASQVKEKFATLRFYTNGIDERQDGMIDFVCAFSAKVCERCGSMDKVSVTQGYWKKSLCVKCMKEELNKYKEGINVDFVKTKTASKKREKNHKKPSKVLV